MIRDRIKTEEYFQEAFEWYSESLRKKLERFDKVKPENLSELLYFYSLSFLSVLVHDPNAFQNTIDLCVYLLSCINSNFQPTLPAPISHMGSTLSLSSARRRFL